MRQGFALFAGISTDVIEAAAREAEARGYASFWVNHPGPIDGLAALGAAARETRRVELGIGVVPLNTRGPASIVEGVRANALPLERLLLGVGSPNPGALGRVRSGVRELRGGLSTRIVVAALGPKMCELAGEIADGAILWLCPPAYVRDVAVPAIERGRRRAGKTLEGFEVVSAVPLAVTDDVAAARAAFRAELARYAALPFYRAMMEAGGLGEGLRAFDRDGQVPESMAAALGAIGDAATAAAYVRAYRQAGVTLPAVRPITFPDAPWYRPTLQAGREADR
jgi:alkanesulfonate monooxygenase SsuD/methylene tetrahydromethanopterin reductase-like flavin-dependent oxidoreductase (luciferase family)